MSGRFSARNWNTRANVYMPVPAIAQAMRAPKGPVAVAKRPGKLKMPAPTIEPMTMAVREDSGSFPSVADAGGDAGADSVGAVVNAISFPFIVPLRRGPTRSWSCAGHTLPMTLAFAVALVATIFARQTMRRQTVVVQRSLITVQRSLIALQFSRCGCA